MNAPQTADQITAALNSMTADVRAMALFGLHAAKKDYYLARAAGHGYATILPKEVKEHNLNDRPWTLLRETNVRQRLDYRFMEEYSPDKIMLDLNRKIELILEGDRRTVQTVIQQWSEHADFKDEWRLDAHPKHNDSLYDAISHVLVAERGGRRATL